MIPFLFPPSFHRGPLPGEPSSSRFANVDGVRLHYVDRGAGPEAVLLLHGYASSLEVWDELAPRLKGRVIAVDLKGFGWTDRPAGDYSPKAQAQLMWRFLEERGVCQASLVAHSWGASVALAMALEQPEQVSRLALYSAWVYPEQVPLAAWWCQLPGVGETVFQSFYGSNAREQMLRAFHDPALVTPELVARVERALERPGTKAAALAALRGQRLWNAEAAYRAIRQPALLLWGDEDRVTPPAVGERLLRNLPNAALVRYARCGHFPMLEAARASTRELVRFLEEGQ